MKKSFPALLIFISTYMDREFTVENSSETSELEKEFLSMHADIAKMASDFMISVEAIENSFTRKKPEEKNRKVKGELASIHKIINKKTMEEKVSGLLEFLPGCKQGTESHNLILRSILKLMYSSPQYLKNQNIGFLNQITGTDHIDKNSVIIEIMDTRTVLESRIHSS